MILACTFSQTEIYKWSFLDCRASDSRKKTSLGETFAKSRACKPIRESGETLGEREKSRQESWRESNQESSWDSLRDF